MTEPSASSAKLSTKRRFRHQGNSSRESSPEASSSDDDCSQRLLDVKDLQNLRKKRPGLSVEELALGKEIPKKIELFKDPLNLKTGGIIDLKRLKRSDWNNANLEEDIRQQFSKESQLRDEDEEMRKFVEEELAKRKGKENPEESKQQQPSNSEDALYELPERLKKYQSKRTEDMLSNQMLCGIPEVDLGIEAKIRNIEETEAEKLRLLKEAREKKKNLEEATTARQDLSKNLAKNYVQHSIFKIDTTTKIGATSRTPVCRPRTQPVAVVADDTPRWLQDGKLVSTPIQSSSTEVKKL